MLIVLYVFILILYRIVGAIFKETIDDLREPHISLNFLRENRMFKAIPKVEDFIEYRLRIFLIFKVKSNETKGNSRS